MVLRAKRNRAGPNCRSSPGGSIRMALDFDIPSGPSRPSTRPWQGRRCGNGTVSGMKVHAHHTFIAQRPRKNRVQPVTSTLVRIVFSRSSGRSGRRPAHCRRYGPQERRAEPGVEQSGKSASERQGLTPPCHSLARPRLRLAFRTAPRGRYLLVRTVPGGNLMGPTRVGARCTTATMFSIQREEMSCAPRFGARTSRGAIGDARRDSAPRRASLAFELTPLLGVRNARRTRPRCAVGHGVWCCGFDLRSTRVRPLSMSAKDPALGRPPKSGQAAILLPAPCVQSRAKLSEDRRIASSFCGGGRHRNR